MRLAQSAGMVKWESAATVNGSLQLQGERVGVRDKGTAEEQ